jgi:hypothetical protein
VLQQYEKFRSSVASHFSVCVFDLAAANALWPHKKFAPAISAREQWPTSFSRKKTAFADFYWEI